MLVCEENPVLRTMMETMLSRLGCRVVSQSDGAEAVRAAMGEVKFDIIFTDLKLQKSATPKILLGLTCKVAGDNLARMIRGTGNTNSNTAIVAVTSYSFEAVDQNLFDGMIEKPVAPMRLQEQLENLCYWRPPAPRRASIRMQREPSTPQRPQEKGKDPPSTV
jgi:serine/threonine-protein kinase RIM15